MTDTSSCALAAAAALIPTRAAASATAIAAASTASTSSSRPATKGSGVLGLWPGEQALRRRRRSSALCDGGGGAVLLRFAPAGRLRLLLLCHLWATCTSLTHCGGRARRREHRARSLLKSIEWSRLVRRYDANVAWPVLFQLLVN